MADAAVMAVVVEEEAAAMEAVAATVAAEVTAATAMVVKAAQYTCISKPQPQEVSRCSQIVCITGVGAQHGDMSVNCMYY